MAATIPEETAKLVAKARETWQLGDYDVTAALVTTRPAAGLVRFAGIAPGDRVLDVATGTGVVALAAARAGGRVTGLDLAPALLEKAQRHAAVAGVEVEFVEGDAQDIRFADASFDVVVSQFGHMFAPDPARTIGEMLRVLRPGGRIAFATWPPEMFTGRMFAMNGKFVPPPPGLAPPPQWGAPDVVQERLGARVRDLVFRRDATFFPVPSPSHLRTVLEAVYGPTIRTVQALAADPARLAAWRAEFDALTALYFDDNAVRQDYLLTRATKA